LKVLDDMVAIEDPVSYFRPLDVTLGDAMKQQNSDGSGAGLINAYLPTKGEYCRQNGWKQEKGEDDSRKIARQRKPIPWQGYYHHDSFGVIWEDLYFPECHDSYANGLL